MAVSNQNGYRSDHTIYFVFGTTTLRKAAIDKTAKADSTLRTSRAVPQPSTNRALCRLNVEGRTSSGAFDTVWPSADIFRPSSISGGCGIHTGHLQWASAAYTLTQPEHDNGEGGSTSAIQCVRVVKKMDSSSIGLCPQGVESPRCRFCLAVTIAMDKRLSWRRGS